MQQENPKIFSPTRSPFPTLRVPMSRFWYEFASSVSHGKANFRLPVFTMGVYWIRDAPL